MPEQKKIVNCFTCDSSVAEFDDNQFGCSCCGSIWSYDGESWNVINKDEVKLKSEWKKKKKSISLKLKS